MPNNSSPEKSREKKLVERDQLTHDDTEEEWIWRPCACGSGEPAVHCNWGPNCDSGPGFD